MRFEFDLTLRDYTDALRLIRKQKLSGRIGRLLTHLVYPLVGVLVAISNFIALRTAGWNLPIAWGLVAGVLLMLVPFYCQWQDKKRFRGLFRDTAMVFELNESDIDLRTPQSDNRLTWAAVCKIRADDRVVLSYLTELKFFIIPKRILKPGELEQLNLLLAAKVADTKLNT